MVHDFLYDPNAKTIVCGGTSATIVSRVLGKRLDVSLDYVDPEIPPIAYMDGVDLVTEGVLTLNRVLQLLRRYVKNETVSEEFFQELDKPNGASMVPKCSSRTVRKCTCMWEKRSTAPTRTPASPLISASARTWWSS